MSQVQSGNTIRLTAQFHDWDGNPIDPSIIKIKFYDRQFNLLEEHSLGSTNREDVGEYYYDYVSESLDIIIYEWYSEIDGLPSLKRDRLTVVQI